MPTALPTFETRTATRSPTNLHIEDPRSLGQLVTTTPAPAEAVTVNRYAHAVGLVDEVRCSIRKVTDRKGPRASINPVDVWFAERDGVRISVGGVAAAVAGIGGLVLCAAAAAQDWTSALIAGASATIFGVPSFFILRAENRLARARERRSEEKLDSRDVERMLAPYVAAPPRDRVVLEGFVRSEIQGLDSALSPKAALTRDHVLGMEASASTDDPQIGRVRDLARAIRALRDQAKEHYRHDAKHVETIEAVIDEAPADERRQIATTLEKMLFAGEHPTFHAETKVQRRIYAAVQRALRGKPTKAEPAD